MHEVIFRGKRKDNCRWVEGFYMKHLKRTPCPIGDEITPEDYQHLILYSGFSDWNMAKPIECVEVIPETVGQYIGLKDKNNKRIFEGDIVATEYGGKIINGVIVFDKGAFKMSWERNLFFFYEADVEVVGNIHEEENKL